MKKICLLAVLLLAAGLCKAQRVSDPFPEMRFLSKFCGKYALDEKPAMQADTNLIAIWKMSEDVDSHNYFVLERYNYYEYVSTYMNREGSNRTYENFGLFFSKVGNADFINVALYDHDTKTLGYFFLKVTDLDKRGWNMTLWLVADTTLKELPGREAVRERLAKNVDNPNYYKAPAHFRKILPLMYCK
jgi:hypothetical protein